MMTSFSVHSITYWSEDGAVTTVAKDLNVVIGKLCALMWPFVWFVVCALHGIRPNDTIHLKYRYGSKTFTLAREGSGISEAFYALQRFRRSEYQPKNMFVILNAQIDGAHQVNSMIESYIGPFGLLPQTKTTLARVFPHVSQHAKCSVMGIKGGVLQTASFGHGDIVDL